MISNDILMNNLQHEVDWALDTIPDYDVYGDGVYDALMMCIEQVKDENDIGSIIHECKNMEHSIREYENKSKTANDEHDKTYLEGMVDGFTCGYQVVLMWLRGNGY